MNQQTLRKEVAGIKAGSCKIGLKPSPWEGVGKILLKGFELRIMKNKKPEIKRF